MESHTSEGNISSPFGYKLVPWVNWDEWNYVRRSIFSSSPNLISSALQKISAWESRGCLPFAIDLTAMVIEIRQKDPFFRGLGSIGDALASEKMLNMLYCMFIMRLVNDFVEPAHKETGRSISSLADAIGIPRTLVDIRHESSHRCLPSLKLARSASAKALEWLKDSYWEPQRIAIHDSRKKVKSRVREMISCVTSRRISRASSTKLKIKCSKRTPLLAACHKLSNTSERLQASKSAEIIKVTKKAAHLYSLYASEVVSFLLEIFLSQAADISDEISIEHSDDSNCSVSKPVAGSLIDLKMVITKLSKKKPRLLLDMLKVVLEMIEEKGSRNFENADENHFLSSQNQIEINQVGHLRALVLHLIRNLKALKESGQITLVEENILLSTDNIAAPRILLSNLLHKCLSLLVPGDKHLLKSVLLLSEMSGNRSLTEKLKKLPLLTILDQNIDPSATTLSYNESMLLKEEDSIEKAEERLRNMKSHLLNVKNGDAKHMSCNSDVPTRWSVTKSWVPCPIGMLPCSFSSAAVLPVFDAMEVEREMEKSETTTDVENVCAADEDEMVCDDEEFSDDGNDAEKLKQMPQNGGSPALENPFPMQGRLLIGGVWKMVSEEELVSLEADVRIFV